MSRRLTHSVAVALTALTCGLGTTACGGGPSKEEAAADKQAQARWETGLTRWSADMASALDDISVLLAHSDTVTRLQKGDAKTTRQLARLEQTLAGCSATLARLGPPSVALVDTREAALLACRSLESGALLVHQGVAVWRNGGGIEELDRAYYALGSGQRGIVHVRSQLKAALRD